MQGSTALHCGMLKSIGKLPRAMGEIMQPLPISPPGVLRQITGGGLVHSGDPHLDLFFIRCFADRFDANFVVQDAGRNVLAACRFMAHDDCGTVYQSNLIDVDARNPTVAGGPIVARSRIVALTDPDMPTAVRFAYGVFSPALNPAAHWLRIEMTEAQTRPGADGTARVGYVIPDPFPGPWVYDVQIP